jgi:soluble lytic murein transglycosylase
LLFGSASRADLTVRRSPRHRVTGWGRLQCLAAALLGLLAAPLPAAPADESTRSAYRDALAHLAAGRITAFHAQRAALGDYALLPYLDYHDLSRRLDSVTDQEMTALRRSAADVPATRLLYHRWLRRLAERGEWARLARQAPESDEAELQCLYRRAQLAVGAASAALAAVPALWTVSHSQPSACDPLFEAWIAAGGPTEHLAWERLNLAIEANQTGLAHYLLRFFATDRQRWAQALYDVHVRPEAVLDRPRFAAPDPAATAVVTHGLRRLATSNPDLADANWSAYRAELAFSSDQSQAIAGAILLARARQGRLDQPWPATLGATPPELVAATLAQTAVNQQQWRAARYWIDLLPVETRSSTRWRYWEARALAALDPANSRSASLYQSLARERDYYGFLAAQRLGLPGQLNAAPRQYDPVAASALRALPAVQRALELYAVNDLVNARREWTALLPTLRPDQQVQAAYLAQSIGWIPQSIQIANAAQLRDHVDLRFPVAYSDLFAAVSDRTAVAKPFLLAIARQESLFDAGARSSADARGVMQLLPDTARAVARQHRLPAPGLGQLHEPGVNVDLGGRHLARLLSRYGGHRPLVAAAYNAGEGRVQRWVRDRSGEPIDIWVETIPFGETRNYVKNVIAFTQVYGQLLDQPGPILSAYESTIP